MRDSLEELSFETEQQVLRLVVGGPDSLRDAEGRLPRAAEVNVTRPFEGPGFAMASSSATLAYSPMVWIAPERSDSCFGGTIGGTVARSATWRLRESDLFIRFRDALLFL